MTTLLHLDASARQSRSLTRRLTRQFVAAWTAARPHDPVIHRDLGRDPPPAISEAWIAAVFTPDGARTPAQRDLIRLSDQLIDELDRADLIVLGTPMYNYGMPTALKGWVDQVVRIGKTFTFDLARGDYPLEPIMSGKTLVVVSSRGEFGFLPGGVRAGMNHLDDHLRTVSHYLGVSEIHVITTEYQEFGGERHAASIARAEVDIAALVDRLLNEAYCSTDVMTEALRRRLVPQPVGEGAHAALTGCRGRDQQAEAVAAQHGTIDAAQAAGGKLIGHQHR